MKRIVIVAMLVTLVGLLVVSLSGSGPRFGVSAGGGAAAVRARVSACVAEDGAWPVVTISTPSLSTLIPWGDVYNVQVTIGEEDPIATEGPSSRHRITIIPEIVVDAGDSLAVLVLAYVGDESVRIFDGNVAVRRGGGTGLTFGPILALEDEPGTGWSILAGSDLGYQHSISLVCSLYVGLYSPLADTGWTAYYHVDHDSLSPRVRYEQSDIVLYHGDMLIAELTVAASGDSTDTETFAVVRDTLTVDHGYKVLAITWGASTWTPNGTTGLRSHPVSPAGASGYRGVYWFDPATGNHSADSLVVTTDPDDGIFAYAVVNPSQQDTFATAHTTYQLLANRQADGALESGSRTLLYYDFKRFLPDTATIVDAKIVVTDRPGAPGAARNAEGGLIAVLDTFALDTPWLAARQRVATSGPFRRCASWAKSNFSRGEGGVPGGPIVWASPYDADTTSLIGRKYLYHFGVTGDPSHVGEDFLTTSVDTVYWDVTRQIQYALHHGVPNNGFWLAWLRTTTTVNLDMALGVLEAQCQHRNPTLWVVYREKRYTPPWNGYEFAVNFQTDDQHVDNLSMAEIAEAAGARITVYHDGRQWLNPDSTGTNYVLLYPPETLEALQTRLRPSQTLDLFGRGHEIGLHSRSHGLRGKLDYDTRLGPDPDPAFVNQGTGSLIADADSIALELDRRWMWDGLATAGLNQGEVDSLDVVRTFAYCPSYGALVVKQLAATGYWYARTTGDYNLQLGLPSTQVPPWNATGGAHAATQATDGPAYVSLGQTFNAFAIASYTTGIWDSGVTTKAQMRDLLAQVFERSWRRGQFAVFIFTHNYTEHITQQKIAWLYEILAERGDVWFGRGEDGRYATARNILGYYRERSQAVDAPEGLTHCTSDAVAADEIYWRGDWRKHWRAWR